MTDIDTAKIRARHRYAATEASRDALHLCDALDEWRRIARDTVMGHDVAVARAESAEAKADDLRTRHAECALLAHNYAAKIAEMEGNRRRCEIADATFIRELAEHRARIATALADMATFIQHARRDPLNVGTYAEGCLDGAERIMTVVEHALSGETP